MDKGGYNRPLFLGSIAAGGTLGILIPPSINMIIYAVLTDTSVADLYAAGFIPGFMLAGLFSMMVLALCLFRPQWAGPRQETANLWEERVSGLKNLLPPLGLFLVVVGSIYAGIATPTEAAALGLMQISLGFMLLSLCRSVIQLNAITNAGAMLLGGLGGALTPVELLPGWAQAVAPAAPTYWAMQGFRAVTMENGGMADVARPVGVLLAFTAAFLLVAVNRFQVEETKVSWA
jgi:hypothetical protein